MVRKKQASTAAPAAIASRDASAGRGRSTHQPVKAGEAAPGGGEPEVGVEAAAEPLEVVGGGDEAAGEDQRHQGRGDDDRPGDADRQRPAEAADGQGDQRAPGELGAQRPPVQLVERVGADPDREEEGGDRGGEAAGVDRAAPPRPRSPRC